jgi:hypothetical protein
MNLMNFKILFCRGKTGFCIGLFFAVAVMATAAPDSVVVGNVRVQLLSGSLVRLELRGPNGFENRNTFHVLNRNWPGISFSTNVEAAEIVIKRRTILSVFHKTECRWPASVPNRRKEKYFTLAPVSWKTAHGSLVRLKILKLGRSPIRHG